MPHVPLAAGRLFGVYCRDRTPVGSDYMGPYTFLASRSWLACAFLLGLMAVLRKMGKTNPAAEPGFWQNK